MTEEIKFKRKNWFRVAPLRNGVMFDLILKKGLEYELYEDDILSVRGEKGDQYFAYKEIGLMVGGYVNKADVRKLSKKEDAKVDLVIVPSIFNQKYN